MPPDLASPWQALAVQPWPSKMTFWIAANAPSNVAQPPSALVGTCSRFACGARYSEHPRCCSNPKHHPTARRRLHSELRPTGSALASRLRNSAAKMDCFGAGSSDDPQAATNGAVRRRERSHLPARIGPRSRPRLRRARLQARVSMCHHREAAKARRSAQHFGRGLRIIAARGQLDYRRRDRGRRQQRDERLQAVAPVARVALWRSTALRCTSSQPARVGAPSVRWPSPGELTEQQRLRVVERAQRSPAGMRVM